MNEEEKLIKEQFNKLPANLQKAINTVPWKSSVKEVALLNKLSFEQVAVVERETMFIIYGFENPSDYIANLVREAQIDEVTATTIAEMVNEKIFKIISQKVEEFDKSKPETPHENLPMVEPGEVAHEVPHVEQPKTGKPQMVQTPNYAGGKDPYREPLG